MDNAHSQQNQKSKSKSSKLKALKTKLPKKDVVISELDMINKRLKLQLKCLNKLGDIADQISGSTNEETIAEYKGFFEAISTSTGVSMETIQDIFCNLNELKLCNVFANRMKKYIKQEKEVIRTRVDENNTIKKNVDTFIKEIIDSFNSASKEATNNTAMDEINRNATDANGAQQQTQTNPNSHKMEVGSKLITNSLFNLYDETKGMSIQNLLKTAKKRKITQNDDNAQKRKRRKKSKS